jgi:hypothetical protein
VHARSIPGARLATRARAWLGAGALAAACQPAPITTPPTAEAPATASTPTPAPPEPTPCGPVGERFESHAWAPGTVTTIVSVQLDAPGLPAALQALGEHVRAPGHGLSIPLSFTLGQWSWQVPVLVATLRQAGFNPAELVYASDDGADHAWIWRSTCDLDEAVGRIEAAWSVQARRTVEGVVATARADTIAGAQTSAFPYDVLMLPGERMALVPAGRASAVLDRFGRPAAHPGLGGAPVPTAGRRLDELDPAAVRLVCLGRALLDPAAPAGEHAPQTLRVTAEGVQAPPAATGDASLPPPP